MEPASQASQTTMPTKGGYPWRPVIMRVVMFVVGGAGGAILTIAVAMLLRFTVVVAINPDDESLGGGLPIVPIILSLSPLGALVGGVVVLNKLDLLSKKPSFHASPVAIAATQKVLLVCLLIQILGAMMGTAGLTPFTAMLGITGSALVAHALGFSRGKQILWLTLVGSPSLLSCVFLLGGEALNPVMKMVLAFATLLTGFITMLVLNQKATRALKAAGLKVGFLGVPVKRFPLLDQHENAGSHPTPAPESSESEHGAGVTDQFYYVGPHNKPIGPVSLDVLHQLHHSGVVTDATMVAREGESQWSPYPSIEPSVNS